MEILNDEFEKTIGQSLKALRMARAMTLDQLATASGVSRAMISKIERGEASPTAVLLARLLAPLKETLSGFFAAASEAPSPLRRLGEQPVWRDPETGYVRRAVSPPGFAIATDLVDVTLPPGARAAMPPVVSEPQQTQYVWLLEGRLIMECDGARHAMEAGDCLYMTLSQGTVFENPGSQACRYAVILRKN
ncbi:helix-turn-helix domain-containing protein [Rhizobium sp. C4]|uniref:helix-turn-helix domain-containing protein n=1 Tax=Rhizobium sp. C4 TaxID=1349800 RepID=UPI001E3A5626|nr:XRE family transcriptional regulator [Rhizobium sp. C4]MCD2172601.1 XRE family transcriptional regulator [Rhizobium sp. C4]